MPNKIHPEHLPMVGKPNIISLTSLAQILARKNVDRSITDELRSAFMLDNVNCPFGKGGCKLEDLDLNSFSGKLDFWKLLLKVASGLKRPDIDLAEFVESRQDLWDKRGQAGLILWTSKPAFFETEIAEGFFKAWGIPLPPLPSEELETSTESSKLIQCELSVNDLQHEINKAKYSQKIRLGHLAMVLIRENYGQGIKNRLISEYKLDEIDVKIGRGMPFWNLYLGVQYRLWKPLDPNNELPPHLFSDKDPWGNSIIKLRELGDDEDRNESHYTTLKDLKGLFKSDNITLPQALYESSADEQRVKLNEELKADQNRKSVLPCQPRTKWEEIKITLLEDGVVRVKILQESKRFSYHQLEMADNRTRDKRPSMLWGLLKIFAQNQGFISRENKYVTKLPDTAKRLNKHLQKIFGINDSIYRGHYKSERGYKTKIFFSDETVTR